MGPYHYNNPWLSGWHQTACPGEMGGLWHWMSSLPINGARLRSHNRLQHIFWSHTIELFLIYRRLKAGKPSISGMVDKRLFFMAKKDRLGFTGRISGSLTIPFIVKMISVMFMDMFSNQEYGISRLRLFCAKFSRVSVGNLLWSTWGSLDISALVTINVLRLGGNGGTSKTGNAIPSRLNKFNTLNFIKSKFDKTSLLTIPRRKSISLIFAVQGPNDDGTYSIAHLTQIIHASLLSNVPSAMIFSGLLERTSFTIALYCLRLLKFIWVMLLASSMKWVTPVSTSCGTVKRPSLRLVTVSWLPRQSWVMRSTAAHPEENMAVMLGWSGEMRNSTVNLWENVTLEQYIWVRSRRCGCLVTLFCYQLIATPGNKTAAPSWPDPFHKLPIRFCCDETVSSF